MRLKSFGLGIAAVFATFLLAPGAFAQGEYVGPSDLERRSLARGFELLGRALEGAGIGRLTCTLGSDDEDPIEGGRHHMGTTRMHPDSTRGVVDADARVHGTENLFVTGSSVFPTAGFANPTLTIVALALRLADHLKPLVAR